MPENRCIGDFARCEPNKKRERNRDYFVRKCQNCSKPLFDGESIGALRVANLIKKEGKSDVADDGLFLFFCHE